MCRQSRQFPRREFPISISSRAGSNGPAVISPIVFRPARHFTSGFNGGAYGSGEQNNGFKAFNASPAGGDHLDSQHVFAGGQRHLHADHRDIDAKRDLRYAESNQPSTAWGYYPSTSPEGGDAWFNNSSRWYDNPVVGNYAWLTIMHETGHLLGLKHPQDVSGSFGAVPVSADSLEYTVMSYRSYIGASTTQRPHQRDLELPADADDV